MMSTTAVSSLRTLSVARPNGDWSTARCLVVNADNFGRSHGINQGIVRAFEHGVVTSASLMVRWPTAAQAADYARRNPTLGVGLQLDLCEWACCDGEWRKMYEVVPVEDAAAVEEQLREQYLEFRQLVGRDPTHLDSHQDIHRSKSWSAAVLQLAEELQIPVRHYSPAINSCGDFYGQDSRGESWPELISASALVRVISTLPSGITELVCHPGVEENSDMMYRRERAWELQALCSPAVRDAVLAAGVHLCSFADIPYSLKATTRLYDRAIALWKRGEKDAAAELLRRELVAKTPAAAATAAQVYLEVDDPLEAWRLVQPLSDKALRQNLLLQIVRSLRANGHLQAAQTAIERACTCDPGDAKARDLCELVSGENDVLRGRWTPPVVATGSFVPIPGRVLHVVGKSLPHIQSGYTVRTHYIAKAQRLAGLDPHVVTQLGFPWSSALPEASLCDEMDDITYHRLPAVRGLPGRMTERLSQQISQLATLVQRLRPSVLHAASDFLNALVALAVGRAFRVPVVYEVRGFWEETWLSKRPPGAVSAEAYQWRRARELQCMLEADHIVTLAEIMKRHIIERGVPHDKITVVPNAVDTDAFQPLTRDPKLAAQLGFSPRDVVVGYISSLCAYEGIPFLIDAIGILRDQGYPVRGLLVGDGEERESLTAHARARKLDDCLIFTGRVPHSDIPRYYSLIDIFVVPRTADRVSQLVTPLKPYEAMATGRAVVVSAVEALQEMVHDGVTGLCFQPEHAESLANVLRRLVQNPGERDRLAQAGLEWVRQHRTWETNAIRYRQLYASLCDGEPASEKLGHASV